MTEVSPAARKKSKNLLHPLLGTECSTVKRIYHEDFKHKRIKIEKESVAASPQQAMLSKTELTLTGTGQGRQYAAFSVMRSGPQSVRRDETADAGLGSMGKGF